MEILKDYSHSEEVESFLIIDRTTNKSLIQSTATEISEIKNNKFIPTEADINELSIEDNFWEEYIQFVMLEADCGTADYLCQRYDTETKEVIPVQDRNGFLDKRLRNLFKNATDYNWFPWVKKAYQSIYSYDSLADNVYISRKKMLDTFIDACRHYKNVMPGNNEIHQIAIILSYNIWQMDRDSCRVTKDPNSPYAMICDWKTNEIKPCIFIFPQDS